MEWWQISLVQAHTTRLALRDADAMAARAAGADHAAAVEDVTTQDFVAEGRRRAEAAFSDFAYVSQSADVAEFALFFE